MDLQRIFWPIKKDITKQNQGSLFPLLLTMCFLFLFAPGQKQAYALAPFALPYVPGDSFFQPTAATILIQMCMKQVKPSAEELFEPTLRRVRQVGAIDAGDLALELANLRSGNTPKIETLSEQQSGQIFQAIGLKQAPTGFQAAQFVVPPRVDQIGPKQFSVKERRLFYAIRADGHCVFQMQSNRANLETLLLFGGWSKDKYRNEEIRRNSVIFPRKFKEIDSINIRTLQASWTNEVFSGTFVMRGNFGVDSNQMYKLVLEQSFDGVKVVMNPATSEEWTRLGMESSQSEWPPSESIHSRLLEAISVALKPELLVDQVDYWRKQYLNDPLSNTHHHWLNQYLTVAARNKLPVQIYSLHYDTVVGDAERTILFGGIPKKHPYPSDVELLISGFYRSKATIDSNLSEEKRRVKGFQSITLLPPKANEGLAKGLATFRLETRADSVEKSYELVMQTAPALTGDKFDSFAQFRLLPSPQMRKGPKVQR
jgi:hypothetical protein